MSSPYLTDPFGPGHLIRFSDSSLYDEICVRCGATDGRHDARLEKPCPMALYPHRAETETEVKPHLVDAKVFGHHNSWVWGTTRYWTFENEDGLRAFLEEAEEGEFTR